MISKILSLIGKQSNKKNPMPASNDVQKVHQIIVPRSAVDAVDDAPWKVVQSVVDYVNFLMSQARLGRDEIPQRAVQIYHADYYLAQVNNGGHAQFIGNAGNNLPFILPDVEGGLCGASASEHMALFRLAMKWVDENPDEVMKQTGFTGGIAPELSALDSPFYALENQRPLTTVLAQWIVSLPELQIVEDEKLQASLLQISRLNPELPQREITASISKINHQLSDPLHLGLGMAAARCQPFSPVLAIGNAVSLATPDGPQHCWSVQTSDGRRFGILSETGVSIHERIEHDNAGIAPVTSAEDLANVAMDDILNYKAPEAGPRLATVSNSDIQNATKICVHVNAAAAIDLLLRNAGTDNVVNFASVRSAGPDAKGQIGVSILVVANDAKRAFSVVVEESGARLLAEPSHNQIAIVSANDIRSHMAAHQA